MKCHYAISEITPSIKLFFFADDIRYILIRMSLQCQKFDKVYYNDGTSSQSRPTFSRHIENQKKYRSLVDVIKMNPLIDSNIFFLLLYSTVDSLNNPAQFTFERREKNTSNYIHSSSYTTHLYIYIAKP